MTKQQRVLSEPPQDGVAALDQELRVSKQQRIEAEIQELLRTETDAVLLSNKLFSPDGLFGQLATTQEERREVAHSPLFKQAQRRVHSLRQREVAQMDGRAPEGDVSSVAEDALYKNLTRLGMGFEVCRRQRLIAPALILIYSAIDTVGWLDSDETDATRTSFINWVDRYLLKAKPLPCTAIELYAARCGLLHTSTAISKLPREGKVRQLVYAWADAPAEKLQRTIDLRNDTAKYVAIHIDELYEAWRLGVLAFMEEIGKDPVRSSKVHDKAQQFFTNLGTGVIEELLVALDKG